MADNNWSVDVSNAMANYEYPTDFDGIYKYQLLADEDENDPAIGCKKEFKANYTCGTTGTKAISLLDAGAGGGRTADLNCKSVYEKCANLVLILGDDGSLSILDSVKEKNVLWTNKDNAALKGLADKAVENSEPNGRTLHSNNNGLSAGEFLGKNEYISSTNNKFRLILDDKAELKVIYLSSGCKTSNSDGIKLENGDIMLDVSASKIYELNSIRPEIGKVGYVDELGVLHEYPSTMTAFSSDFKMVGNYGLIGGDLGQSSVVNNAEDCKRVCSSYNSEAETDNEKCVGFVYEKTGKVCQMKDSTIYTSGNRFMNDNFEYYMRNKDIQGQDASCPKIIKNKTADFWGTFTLGDDMSGNTKCGLAKFTEDETEAVKQANASLNNKFVNSFISIKNGLRRKFSKIKQRINNSGRRMDTKLKDLQDTREDLGDWTGNQLKQLEAMNEDRDLNRISQNYKHILWSILAIIIIIAAIRISRTDVKTAE